MRVNNLKRALREGGIVLGPFMKLSSPALVEIMGACMHLGEEYYMKKYIRLSSSTVR